MKSGDACPICPGRLIIVNTKISRGGRHRIRYCGCRACGFRPLVNKTVIPIEYAPPKVSATSSSKATRKVDQPE